MQMDQLKQSIDRVEECTDEAKRALQAGSAPDQLRQCIDQMHQQAHQMQQAASSPQQQQQMNQESLRNSVNQLEQTPVDAAQAGTHSSGDGPLACAGMTVRRSATRSQVFLGMP